MVDRVNLFYMNQCDFLLKHTDDEELRKSIISLRCRFRFEDISNGLLMCFWRLYDEACAE